MAAGSLNDVLSDYVVHPLATEVTLGEAVATETVLSIAAAVPSTASATRRPCTT